MSIHAGQQCRQRKVIPNVVIDGQVTCRVNINEKPDCLSRVTDFFRIRQPCLPKLNASFIILLAHCFRKQCAIITMIVFNDVNQCLILFVLKFTCAVFVGFLHKKNCVIDHPVII